MQIHQMLAALSYGDAIGNEALRIQQILRESGFDSEIFAESVHPEMAGSAKKLWDYRNVSSTDNLLILHFSIGAGVSTFAYHLPDPILLIYHNITPARWFATFHPHLAGQPDLGLGPDREVPGVTVTPGADLSHLRLHRQARRSVATDPQWQDPGRSAAAGDRPRPIDPRPPLRGLRPVLVNLTQTLPHPRGVTGNSSTSTDPLQAGVARPAECPERTPNRDPAPGSNRL